ncbi:MAG: efflux transporter outer membrane subunit [Acidisphaera sp.]|nr:efflux transporter outer membrane subunit [Acidisphaera sp.]
MSQWRPERSPVVRAAWRGRTITALAALLLLPGCNLGPFYHRPSLELPAAFRATPATEAAAWPSPDWWRGFGSPELDGLIAAARVQNFDIAAAVARVRQADAAVSVAGGPLLPLVTASASDTWQLESSQRSGGGFAGASSAHAQFRSYAATVNASYEVDFWGKNRAALAAARASALFSRFDQQTVALTVVTGVATTYFNALAYQDRLAVAQRNLADATDSLNVIRARLSVGTATALDLAQQEALVDAVRANIPALRSQLEQEVIALAILVGRPPEAIEIRPGTLDTLPLPEVAPGLPSDLLARRPDIASAEAQLIAQNANVRVARAAFFPSIQLTASGGWQSLALTTLFGPGATAASFAGSVSQTLFDNGVLAGQLGEAKGRYDELLADYRKAVVQAFTDVENALTALRYATEQETLERAAVATAQRAADIARAQLAAGTVDVTTVLTAEQTLFSDQDTLAQVRLARFTALVNLYKALGGGWQEPQETASE